MDHQLWDETIDSLLEDDSQEKVYQVKPGKRGRPSRYHSWTKQQTFSLILLFKQHPLLYDSTHPKYALPIYRNKALREIYENIRIYKPGVTIQEMRAKLKTLRSQYMKEKRRIEGGNNTPRLWCYDHMRFLDDRGMFLEEEREQSLAGPQPDDCYVEENENEIYVRSFDETDSEERVNPFSSGESEPKPKSVLYQKCLNLVKTLSQIEDEKIEQRPAADFGRMVELELSNFPEDIYDDAKWKIIKVLEEASKKNKQEIKH